MEGKNLVSNEVIYKKGTGKLQVCVVVDDRVNWTLRAPGQDESKSIENSPPHTPIKIRYAYLESKGQVNRQSSVGEK